jgi:proteasome lid subunit RPN8/RPN11
MMCSDSEEYPVSYKRGIKGLDQKLEAISIQTADNLRYVGEWHSHPKGCSTRPSEDDKTNFEWIRKILKNEDLPPLSLIIGDDKKHTIYLETMK